MKRSPLIVIGALLVLVAGWLLFMAYINNSTTTLDVQAANVDEVLFFDADNPAAPIATIAVNGQETEATIKLHNTTGRSVLVQDKPAQYYYVAKQGDQSYTSPTICCETGLAKRETLVIRGLGDWERRGQ